NFAERIVKNVSRRVIQHRRITSRAIDAQAHAPSRLKLTYIAAQDSAQVHDRAIMFARISDFDQAPCGGLDHTPVANLAAGLRIERSFRGNKSDAAVLRLSSDKFGFRLIGVVQELRSRSRS